MKTLFTRRWLIGCAALLLAGIIASFAPMLVKGADANRAAIQGNTLPALNGAAYLHTADGQSMLNLTISLQLPNAAGLQALISAQNDRKSPRYHHYLTAQQFTALFAPSQSSVDQVVSFLKGQGLNVTSVASNRLTVDVTASVVTIEQAFDTHIADYSLRGRTVYAPTTAPSVPAALAPLILNVAGLDDLAPPQRLGAAPLTVKKANGVSGPGGGYTPATLRTAYDMNPVFADADGAGQTIAIAEFDGYNPADINQYLSFYNLGAPQYSNVFVDGATNAPGVNAVEVALDMEVVSAIAPNAAQKIYIAPNTGQAFIDLFNKIVSDDTAKVVSDSWGNCESVDGTGFMQTMDTIFSAGASQGQAFFAASGDFGAYDCGTKTLAVDYPASDPHVVGVGGTSLTVNSTDGTYTSEMAWGCPICQITQGFPPLGTGSGGGISSFWSQPSYQTGPGVINVFSNGHREVPDVAADADPNTGYSIYCTVFVAGCPTAGWGEVGGTSGAAPLWAGVVADLNEYLQGIGKPTFGSASAMLYSLENNAQGLPPFHDIRGNDNLYYGSDDGYDLATGLGTPDVWNIALNLRGNIPTVTPSVINIGSSVGTNPADVTFTIKNTTTSEYDFTLNPLPAAWSSTISQGALAPGDSISGTLSFNVSDSVPFTYRFTLLVQDTSNVLPNLQVPIILTVGATSKVWYFAEGYTGGSFSEYLTIANPNAAPANVKVEYFLGSGGPITKLYSIAPNSRFTLLVNDVVGSNKNVSMTILSDNPIIAERPMYFTYSSGGLTVPGGSDVLGATQLSQSFDFGYLDTTKNHQTYLTILNQNNASMTATIKYYPSAGGTPITRTHTVAANSRGTVFVNGDGLAAGTYSAFVSLSLPGLVERPLYEKDSSTGFTGSADVVGVANPQTDWYFAEGYTSSTFSERYILSNPNTTTAANATVTFLLANGSTQTASVQIPPGGQKIISANSVLGSNNVNNSAHVNADIPILAERFISFKYVGPVGFGQSASIPGASDVLGASVLSRLFYFAEGYTGGQFAEYLTVENPDPTQTAFLQVTFYPATSPFPVQQMYSVPPHSRFTLLTNNVMIQQSFSMSVFSSIPIVAERPMYFVYNGKQTGGTDVIGEPA